MRPVQVASQAPPGAVRVVGVAGDQPLDELDIAPAALRALGFEGVAGKVLPVPGEEPAVLVGLGDTFDVEDLRTALGAVGRALPVSTPLATSLHHLDMDGALAAVISGLQMGSYRFDRYRRAEQSGVVGTVTLIGGEVDAEVARLETVEAAVTMARDWGNTAAADKAPASLAADMAGRLERAGYDVEIWDGDRVRDEGLGGLAAVGAGSDRPPSLLLARRRTGADQAHLALVGKGIVFDSGGLSLKKSEDMETMKGDMAGAAAVVAGAAAIGELATPIAVSVFVPLADNMSGGSAVKLGDVVRARNGKTIEILNTDAEGRLVLADALSLAVEAGPDLIVDMATLTGGARVALGDHIAAVFGSDETSGQIIGAAAEAGERMWPLPLPVDYRKLIDSTVADMKNTGGRYGSAIAAALLLAEFVADVPWGHIDIAGPSWLREEGPLGPKGASGFGVRTLVELASSLAR